MRTIEYLYKKDIGGREEQQDSVNIVQNKKETLIALADGMGGHSGGRRASEIFIATAEEHFKNKKYSDVKKFFNDIISDSVTHIEAYAKESEQDPHTTATLALVKGKHLYFANVGDSRVYLFDNKTLVTRSRDHSVPEMLFQMGEIEEHEMATHPDQNKLTKSLGSNTQCKPTHYQHELKKNSDYMILVCSDGFWEYVKEEEMRYFLLHFELNKAVNSMIDLAKQRGGERGDNISVGVITLFQDTEEELEVTEEIQKVEEDSKKNPYIIPMVSSLILMGILLIAYIL